MKEKNLSASLWSIGLVIILYYALEGIRDIIIYFWENDMSQYYYQIDSYFCILCSMLFFILYYRMRKKEERQGIYVFDIEPYKYKIYDYIIAFIVIMGTGGISILWLNYADIIFSFSSAIVESSEAFSEYWTDIGNEAYIWSLLSIVIFGPIMEELLFRGLIFHSLSKFKGGVFAIIISGVLFGIWHGELVQTVYTAIMGIALAAVYYKTRSMVLVILMHILNNFTSTLPEALDIEPVHNLIYEANLRFLIPALVIMFALSLSAYKSEKKKKEWASLATDVSVGTDAVMEIKSTDYSASREDIREDIFETDK